MPAYDTKNVVAASPQVTGGVLIGETSDTLPTDATTAPAAAFVSAGYVSEDGLTEAISRDVEKIKAWGGKTVKILTTSVEQTYSFTLIESANQKALEVVYGSDAVEATANGYKVKISDGELPEKAFVFDMIDKGNGVLTRIVLPKARVSELGDITYTHGAVVGYEVTIDALPDEDGVFAYKYTETPAVTP